MTEMQTIFNFLIATIGGIGGWWLNTMWQAMRELEKKVASIDVLVAGQYIRKDEFNSVVQALFAKLDKIENKLDGKADKS